MTINSIIVDKTSTLNITKKSGKSYMRLSETNKVINVNESLKKKHYSFSMTEIGLKLLVMVKPYQQLFR